jgi:polysaccharide transporter, PST family
MTTALPTRSGAILGIFGRNALWLWLDLGALRVGTLIAGIFLIRYFGPANFGIYSLAMAVGFLGNAVVDLGLTRYAARTVAASPDAGPPILALSLSTTGATAFLEIMAGIALAFSGHWYGASICAGLVLVNIEGTALLCSAILTACLRSREILPASIVGGCALILLVVTAIFFHLSVFTFLALGSVRTSLVLIIRLRQLKNMWPRRSDWRWPKFVGTARRALPYLSYNLTQVGYGRMSVVCFGMIATQVAVGWFSAAYVLSDIFPQWSYAPSNALLPLWTRLFEQNRACELIELRQRLLDVLLFVSMPIAVALSTFAHQVCRTLGTRFAASAAVLTILAYRVVLSSLDGFWGHGFLIAVNRVSERQRAQGRLLLVLAALTVILGHFLGAQGAALALFVTDSLLLVQYLFLLRRVGMRVELGVLLPALLAGAGMALAALRLPSSFGFGERLATALLAYLLLLVVLSPRRVLGATRTLRQCLTGA